jgi:hypothetical protein
MKIIRAILEPYQWKDFVEKLEQVSDIRLPNNRKVSEYNFFKENSNSHKTLVGLNYGVDGYYLNYTNTIGGDFVLAPLNHVIEQCKELVPKADEYVKFSCCIIKNEWENFINLLSILSDIKWCDDENVKEYTPFEQYDVEDSVLIIIDNEESSQEYRLSFILGSEYEEEDEENEVPILEFITKCMFLVPKGDD